MTHILQLLRITSINQHEIVPSGEVDKIQSSSVVELGGGDTTKEDVDEQTITQVEEQV